MKNVMVRPKLNVDWWVLGSIGWWGWAVMPPLLALRFAGHVEAVGAAAAICGGLALHDVLVRRTPVQAIGVQIRVGFLAMLALGLLPGMAWLHGVMLAGTSARVLVGYCLLDRELRMMPWNFKGHLSLVEAWRILVTRPGMGGLLRVGGGTGGEVEEFACACDMRAAPHGRTV